LHLYCLHPVLTLHGPPTEILGGPSNQSCLIVGGGRGFHCKRKFSTNCTEKLNPYSANKAFVRTILRKKDFHKIGYCKNEHKLNSRLNYYYRPTIIMLIRPTEQFLTMKTRIDLVEIISYMRINIVFDH